VSGFRIAAMPGMEADAGSIDELKMGREVGGGGREAAAKEARDGAWC
jgi:hypothetical protein